MLLAANLVYGAVQLRATRGAMRDGPKIAVLQGNYPNYVDVADHPELPTQVDRANRYFELLDAAEEDKPDLFLLPETPWYMYLNHEYLASGPGERWSQQCYDAFRERAMAYSSAAVRSTASLSCAWRRSSRRMTSVSMKSRRLSISAANSAGGRVFTWRSPSPPRPSSWRPWPGRS